MATLRRCAPRRVGWPTYAGLRSLAPMLALDLGGGAELRALEPWNADEFAAHVEQAREHLKPWIPFASRVVDAEGARELLQRFADWQAHDEGRIYGIWIDGVLSGGTLFKSFDTRSAVCEIGVWLAPQAQGRGLIGAAARLMIDWALRPRAGCSGWNGTATPTTSAAKPWPSGSASPMRARTGQTSSSTASATTARCGLCSAPTRALRQPAGSARPARRPPVPRSRWIASASCHARPASSALRCRDRYRRPTPSGRRRRAGRPILRYKRYRLFEGAIASAAGAEAVAGAADRGRMAAASPIVTSSSTNRGDEPAPHAERLLIVAGVIVMLMAMLLSALASPRHDTRHCTAKLQSASGTRIARHAHDLRSPRMRPGRLETLLARR